MTRWDFVSLVASTTTTAAVTSLSINDEHVYKVALPLHCYEETLTIWYRYFRLTTRILNWNNTNLSFINNRRLTSPNVNILYFFTLFKKPRFKNVLCQSCCYLFNKITSTKTYVGLVRGLPYQTPSRYRNQSLVVILDRPLFGKFLKHLLLILI